MKTSLALAAPVVIVFLILQNVQAVDSSCDSTYPYKHVRKNNTAEYDCWYWQCKNYMKEWIFNQTSALSLWENSTTVPYGEAEVVRQFHRLKIVFHDADYYNLTQCKQDFPEVLQLQKDAYNNVYNVCVVEATKQNKVNYKSNINATTEVLVNLDRDIETKVYDCIPTSDMYGCIDKVKAAAMNQLTYEASRAKNRIMWYQRRIVFDNENSVRECVALKTFQQVRDIKKIVNTVKECISLLI